MKIKEVIGSVYTDITSHWSQPKKGNYISYKELTAYSVGGMGVQFFAAMMGYIALTANSFLFGSAFGIDPVHLQLLSIVSTVINFFLTPLKSMMIDNTRSKSGKYRPYILWCGIPTAIFSILIVFVPIDSDYFVKLVLLFVLFVLSQFFYTLNYTAYMNFPQVMSPNSEERTKTIAISSIVYSMAPTFTGFIIPLVASAFPNQLTDIGTYKLLFPIFSVLGVLLNFLVYFGTKERIIVSKKYVPRVKFRDGMESVFKNKYFWITTISGVFAILRTATAVIFPWLMQYGVKTTVFGMDNMALYAILVTILGSASLPGMAFAPLLIKKLGKKNVIIYSNTIYMISTILLFFLYQNVLLFFVLNWIWACANSVQIVTGPAVGADIADYQQYKTGERLEGFLGQTGGLITGITGLATGLIIPFIYRYFGLGTDYNVLYVDDIRNNIFVAMIVVAIIGNLLVTLPYFLYDLKESKHKDIIKVLKVRALFEDYAAGMITDTQLVNTIDEIDNAEAILKAEVYEDGKKDLLAAKVLPKSTAEEKKTRKEAVKQAKKVISEAANLKEQKLSAQMVFDELTKFSSGKLAEDVAKAQALVEGGFEGMIHLPEGLLAQAKALPKTNLKEITARDKAIREAQRAIKYSKKIQKVYPEGVVEPAADLLKNAVDMDEELGKERRKAIKSAENEIRTFNRTLKPLIEARRLLKQEEDYQAYEEIRGLYADALMRVTQQELEDEQRRAQIEADHKAEMEEYKQAKFDALPPKKQEKILAKRAKKEAAKEEKQAKSDKK